MGRILLYLLAATSILWYLVGGVTMARKASIKRPRRRLEGIPQVVASVIREKYKSGDIRSREDFERLIQVHEDSLDFTDTISSLYPDRRQSQHSSAVDVIVNILETDNVSKKETEIAWDGAPPLEPEHFGKPLVASVDATDANAICRSKGYSTNCRVIFQPTQAIVNCSISQQCVPVPIRWGNGMIYFPQCVSLQRCMGLCCDRNLGCAAARKSVVLVKIHAYKFEGIGKDNRPRFNHDGHKYVKMEEHISCQCNYTSDG